MRKHLLLSLLFALVLPALADEAVIRKTLSERLKDFPNPDEVSKTPMPGIWEVRVGADLFYTDAAGQYLIEGGAIIDTRDKANLTQQRVAKLTAIAFADLPLKDALVFKQGNGSRKLAVFGDPNCGYCKQLERDLLKVKDVTIYAFVFPVLGPDSDAKSRAIWCSKDAAAAWRGWMTADQPIQRPLGPCDAKAIDRTVAFGRKHKINGTPALVFEDGLRVPGAMRAADVEKRLTEARQAKKG
jgi:thiol:disulfide interchange protein DsbC